MKEGQSLRKLLAKNGIQQKVVSEALGLERINIGRYDDLSERRVSEVIAISKATGINFSELIGMYDSDMKAIDSFIIKYPERVKEENSAVVESLKETIEALKEVIKSKDELIEILKNR